MDHQNGRIGSTGSGSGRARVKLNLACCWYVYVYTCFIQIDCVIEDLLCFIVVDLSQFWNFRVLRNGGIGIRGNVCCVFFLLITTSFRDVVKLIFRVKNDTKLS